MTFQEKVVAAVSQIPVGQVATYGQLAGLAGSPRGARAVGTILHQLPELDKIPWQRVINSRGYLSTTCLEHPAELQAALLKADGIIVNRPSRGLFRVDLRRFLWQD